MYNNVMLYDYLIYFLKKQNKYFPFVIIEEKAAQAFDKATINLYGPSAKLNFPIELYEHEID